MHFYLVGLTKVYYICVVTNLKRNKMNYLKTRINYAKREATVWEGRMKYRLALLTDDEINLIECGITSNDLKDFSTSIVNTQILKN